MAVNILKKCTSGRGSGKYKGAEVGGYSLSLLIHSPVPVPLPWNFLRSVPGSFSSDSSGRRAEWGPRPPFLYAIPLSPTLARPRSRTGGGEKAETVKQEGGFCAVPPLTPRLFLVLAPEGPTLAFPSPHLCPCQSPPGTGNPLPLTTVTPAEWSVCLSLPHPLCSARAPRRDLGEPGNLRCK